MKEVFVILRIDYSGRYYLTAKGKFEWVHVTRAKSFPSQAIAVQNIPVVKGDVSFYSVEKYFVKV